MSIYDKAARKGVSTSVELRIIRLSQRLDGKPRFSVIGSVLSKSRGNGSFVVLGLTVCVCVCVCGKQ